MCRGKREREKEGVRIKANRLRDLKELINQCNVWSLFGS